MAYQYLTQLIKLSVSVLFSAAKFPPICRLAEIAGSIAYELEHKCNSTNAHLFSSSHIIIKKSLFTRIKILFGLLLG